MDGLGLLLVLIGMTMLIHWLYQHDKAPQGKTRGLYALREPAEGAGMRAERGRLQGRPGPRGPAAKPASPSAAALLLPVREAPPPGARLPFQRD